MNSGCYFSGEDDASVKGSVIFAPDGQIVNVGGSMLSKDDSEGHGGNCTNSHVWINFWNYYLTT